MNIAIFTETYLPYINGVVTHVRLLKEGLEKLGHSVLIVTADPTVKRHRLENGILRCPAFSIKRIYGYGVAFPVSARRLRYLIRFKPEIIHIHNEFGVGFFGLQSASILGVPLVYTIHTMYDDYLHYIAPEGMTNVLNKTMSFYLKRFTSNASAIIGPSAKVEDFCKRHHLDAKVFIIRNCPDIDMFSPANARVNKIRKLKKKYNISRGDKILVTISRIAQEKSMDMLINYFVKCFSRDPGYKMFMVGDGRSFSLARYRTPRSRITAIWRIFLFRRP
jgi:1,2-diacylglycerol 3-alpha-glucosyltransferase